MSQGDSIGHPHQDVPGSSTALGCPYGNRLQPSPQVFMGLLMATWAIDPNTDLGCGRTMDPDVVLVSSLGPDVTMVPGGIIGHLDQHDPHSSMALRHQYSHRLQPRSQASTWLLSATWVRDISADPGRGRTTDQDTILGSSLDQAVTMVPDGCAGHPDWYGPHTSTACGHQCDLRWQPRPQGPARPPVAIGAPDINPGPLGCSMAWDQDLAPAIAQAQPSP